ncbi:MAG: electron transport complex protein RnfA [Dethiobacteria bacterium]|nr:Rnf-Nqr domain containing protein [Bacillota bacterium]
MNQMLSIFLASILTHNIVLVYILGMCPTIGVSKNLRTATGMGAAVIFVVTITSLINWLIYNLILIPTGSEIISLMVFIITIAAIVQLLEMLLEKYMRFLYTAFGVFLPLITVNCAVLGVTLFMVLREYTLGQTMVFALGSSGGFFIAIMLVAGIREKLDLIGDPPKGLQGPGIVMIILGILALGFMGFGGMVEL